MSSDTCQGIKVAHLLAGGKAKGPLAIRILAHQRPPALTDHHIQPHQLGLHVGLGHGWPAVFNAALWIVAPHVGRPRAVVCP